MLNGIAYAVTEDPYPTQRERFLEARTALSKDQRSQFRQLMESLHDYPLQPYLEYWETRRYLGTQTPAHIRTLLSTLKDTPLASRLRQAWLLELAKQNRWETFQEFYLAPQGVELQCYALQAQLTRQQPEELAGVLDQAQALWLVGHSQPSACDPVFDQLYASGRITQERIWERIHLAMENNKPGLASFLAKKLSAEDREWVARWTQVHNRPAQHLQDPAFNKDTALTRTILLHGLRRLARAHPEQAWAHWDRMSGKYAFSEDAAAQTQRAMAMPAAYRHHPQALEWLERVPRIAADDVVLQWRVRAALPLKAWQSVLDAIAAMSYGERNKTEWRYWQAQALFAQDKRMEALKILGELARERDYHGFLSADFLDWKYAMNDEKIEASEAELGIIAEMPAFIRARELYRAGLNIEARREWYHGTQDLSPRALQIAARLAHQWGWHDRAIITAAKAGHYTDLSLRFPVLYKKEVFATAKGQRLDPALILGVIRQESAFMTDARSSAGALGLMQLMPSTGRQTARQERIKLPSTSALLNSDKNISIGSAYLRRMLEKFGDNPALATAAYNAGPHRVNQWWPDDDQATQVWVDRIPFTETRNYVRNVLAYSAIFEHRLNRPITRMKERLPDIKKAATP